MTKTCNICGHLIHEGDQVTFSGEATFHEVPSKVSFAISDITACYDIAHTFCGESSAENYA